MNMNEKEYLRELAKKYIEYANLPVMDERTKMWYKHNDGDKNYTPVIIETMSFEHDILPELKCTTPQYQEMEYILLSEICRHEIVGDDRVIPKVFPVRRQIRNKQFNIELEREKASTWGYHIKEFIVDIDQDLHKLSSSVYSFDETNHQKRLAVANDVLGDIIPVVSENTSLHWEITLSRIVVDLMSMENFFVAMMDSPERVHDLFSFISNDMEKYVLWQQEQGLLCSNIGNHYVGSGSYGFTNELVATGDPQKARLSEMWGNANSQESVGLSTEMFAEFIFPYYLPITRHFGKMYWGCCEAVDTVWDSCLSKMDNLSKVSISAWCNEAIMSEKLANGKIIYSRKPSPNFIGVGEIFDEQGFTKHIKDTLNHAKDCNIEFIMRDIYSLCGDQGRAKKAVDIIREQIRNR